MQWRLWPEAIEIMEFEGCRLKASQACSHFSVDDRAIIIESHAMNTANDLLTQALGLPECERAALAKQLLLSLEPEGSAGDSDEAWALEIEARLAAIGEGRFQAKDWRQALT